MPEIAKLTEHQLQIASELLASGIAVSAGVSEQVLKWRKNREITGRIQANAARSYYLLARIIDSLPSGRDWLDPAIEAESRDLMREVEAADA